MILELTQQVLRVSFTANIGCNEDSRGRARKLVNVGLDAMHTFSLSRVFHVFYILVSTSRRGGIG